MELSTGDTAWMLIATVFVLMMNVLLVWGLIVGPRLLSTMRMQ